MKFDKQAFVARARAKARRKALQRIRGLDVITRGGRIVYGRLHLGNVSVSLGRQSQETGEYYPTAGVYVGVPYIDVKDGHGINAARFPLAAAHADLVYGRDGVGSGKAALEVVGRDFRYRMNGKRTVTEQYAARVVKREYERAGRLDLWLAAKNRSGRPA